MRALLLLAIGCGDISADLPAPGNLACGIRVTVVESPPPGKCLRIDADYGALVRKLGDEGCDSWAECVTLGPGESGEYGTKQTELGDGHVMTSGWDCDRVPPCEQPGDANR